MVWKSTIAAFPISMVTDGYTAVSLELTVATASTMQKSVTTSRPCVSEIVIDCPIPPSANRLWRVGKKGQVYISPKFKRWLRSLWVAWLQVKPQGFRMLEGQYDIEILICPKRKRDADNSAKATNDALQKIGVIANDSQARRVVQELVEKERAPSGCRLRIVPLA